MSPNGSRGSSLDSAAAGRRAARSHAWGGRGDEGAAGGPGLIAQGAPGVASTGRGEVNSFGARAAAASTHPASPGPARPAPAPPRSGPSSPHGLRGRLPRVRPGPARPPRGSVGPSRGAPRMRLTRLLRPDPPGCGTGARLPAFGVQDGPAPRLPSRPKIDGEAAPLPPVQARTGPGSVPGGGLCACAPEAARG